MLNDYQQAGPNNGRDLSKAFQLSGKPQGFTDCPLATLLFYDQPEYDVFWQMVSDLDVPVYFHPRNNIPEIFQLSYGHSPWLAGPGQEYAVTLSNHILG